MNSKDYKGVKVEFPVIKKDSKRNDKPILHRGHIKSLNKSGTGFVIRGETIPGLYNRCLVDITILEIKKQEPAIEIINCPQIIEGVL